MACQIGVFILARLFFNPIHFLTIGFAAVVIGLGVDFGLHLTARFTQLASGDSIETAIKRTMSDAGPPIVAGAVSTAVAFLALLLTNNSGLIQFGMLTSAGLLLTLALTLLLFPALAKTLGEPLAQTRREAHIRVIPLGVFRFAGSRPILSLAIAMAVLLVSLPFAVSFRFDQSIRLLFPSQLKALDVAADLSKTYGSSFGATTGVTVQAPDLSGAMSEQERLDRRLAVMVNDGDIVGFESPSMYFVYPSARIEKNQAWARARTTVYEARERFERLLTELRFRTTSELDDYYELIEQVITDGEASGQERFPNLSKYFARTDEGYRLRTYVAPSASAKGESAPTTLRVSRDLVAFASQAGSAAPRTSTTVSGLVQIYQRVNELMLADFAGISWIAAALVAAIVLLFFRSLRLSLLALGPLAAALPVTIGLLHAADVRLLPLTIGFAAIIIGVGIDDAVHILARILKGPGGVEAALLEIGPIITLTTVSTIIGFGSLVLCRLTVVSSLGASVAVGVGACWFFSVFLLPAACRFLIPASGTSASKGHYTERQ